MHLIDELYTKHPFYGSRQLRNALRLRGYKINRKKVQRLMRRMGLVSVAPKPNTSQPCKANNVYPYLLGGITINQNNQVWCTDITYIRMPHGFVYLSAVLDWHSRFVLSWELSVTMEESFCVSSLETALRRYDKPEIFNTDQGAQYTSRAFTGVLKMNEIKISMDGKGRAMDNIMIERLWRSVKYEEVYLKDYQSIDELKHSLKAYFEFYNYERPHQAHEGRTPAEIYGVDRELIPELKAAA
jgi:putative transposase